MHFYRDYPHLVFRKQWDLSEHTAMILGQCVALIKAINNTPILPDYYKELMRVALIKGAQSTTAIEGNTLSELEIEKIRQGEKLPPSKEYMEIEVQNIMVAFNEILNETVYEQKEQLITIELLQRFHKMIGKNLGDHFNAVPGRFRENDVVVGTYRCPDHRDVMPLMEKYCEWLRTEFKFDSGNQPFHNIIIQAIVAHVYLEWIHPFGDGNGRTGRLIEFYILSRGGSPDIALHILSNHYNATRPEYYRQLEKAFEHSSLSGFMDYALLGFRDGLQQTLETIQASQLLLAWQKFVYDTFNAIDMKNREVFKRRRGLALSLPIDKKFTPGEIPTLSIPLAAAYSTISAKTLARDIDELVTHKIIIKEDGLYFANIQALNRMIAKRKGLILH